MLLSFFWDFRTKKKYRAALHWNRFDAEALRFLREFPVQNISLSANFRENCVIFLLKIFCWWRKCWFLFMKICDDWKWLEKIVQKFEFAKNLRFMWTLHTYQYFTTSMNILNNETNRIYNEIVSFLKINWKLKKTISRS